LGSKNLFPTLAQLDYGSGWRTESFDCLLTTITMSTMFTWLVFIKLLITTCTITDILFLCRLMVATKASSVMLSLKLRLVDLG